MSSVLTAGQGMSRTERLRQLRDRVYDSRYCSAPATACLFLTNLVGKKVYSSNDFQNLTDDELGQCLAFMVRNYPDRYEAIRRRVERDAEHKLNATT